MSMNDFPELFEVLTKHGLGYGFFSTLRNPKMPDLYESLFEALMPCTTYNMCYADCATYWRDLTEALVIEIEDLQMQHKAARIMNGEIPSD